MPLIVTLQQRKSVKLDALAFHCWQAQPQVVIKILMKLLLKQLVSRIYIILMQKQPVCKRIRYIYKELYGNTYLYKQKIIIEWNGEKVMPIEINHKDVGRIPHSCFVRLQAVYDSLKSAERKATDLLLTNPELFLKSSIVEVADAAGCSEATLVRLARRMGFSGYSELKAFLSDIRGYGPAILYAGISEGDTYESVIEKVFQASIQALKDTLNIIDKNEYYRAVEAIANAGRIVLCGVGDAANVALSGFQKLIRLGVNVQASADPDIQLIAASHLSKGDVIIAISHSGKTKSVIDTVKYSRNTEATVISITNYPVSPLAKISDIVLLTAAFTEHVNGEVMSKRVTEMCLLESLYVNVLLKKKEYYIEKLKRSKAALEVNKL